MTLARRMWLASAALALLVGAAFTALILAVSAQREATDREARSKDVTRRVAAAGEGRVGRRVELPQLRRRRAATNSLEAYTRRERTAAGRAAESRRPSSSDDPSQRASAQEIENADPGVRVRLRSRRWSRSCEEIPGISQERLQLSHRASRSQTDEIRRLFTRLPRGGEQARRRRRASDADERTDIAVLVGAHRGRGLDGADRALRDRARALDRPSGARGRRRRQPDRGRRALAPAARGGPRRGRRADARVQRDGGAARGGPPRARGSRTRSCARASAGRPSSSASSPTSCGRRSRACSGSRRCC